MEARIIAAIDGLATAPRRYPVAPESRKYDRELRHLVVSSFRIVYEVREGVVVVHQVRHSARLPADDISFQ